MSIEQAIEFKVVKNEEGDNEFLLQAPKSVKNEVGTEIFTFAEESIEDINVDVVSNEVAITDNGTVYDPNDNSLCIQGGNINKFKKYWWGYRSWASRRRAADIQDEFNKISTGAWGVASVAGIYSAVMYSWMATDIGTVLRKNPKKGVIISLYLSCAYSVKRQ